MRRVLPTVVYNPLTLIGSVIAGFNLGLMVLLLVINLASARPSPYADLIILLILPVFVLAGVTLIIIGIVRQRRRRQAGVAEGSRLLVIDFNDSRQRTWVILVSISFIILTLIYAFAMYQGYEFVESDYFCGQACHSVMGPEYTAHAGSYHAQVECSACHVGSGTNYFLISKFRGVNQLSELLLDSYSRPIPVPLTDLRPSKQICGSCHAPETQLTAIQEERTFYLSDAGNTPWKIDILFKVAGGSVETDNLSRMHWHSSVASEIDYATADPRREDIPWIRAVGLDGQQTIYFAKGSKSREQVPAGARTFEMDCNDCHNRTGHDFSPADKIINGLINTGSVDPSLPGLKSVASKTLDGTYATQDDGVKAIDTTITEYYRKSHPEVYASKKEKIENSIEAIQDAYRQNYNPAMRASWKDFPDNSGHMYTMGCFRCHDDNHVSSDGKVLSKDCSVCHLLLEERVEAAPGQVTLTNDPYPHPVDIGDSYRDKYCSDCHGPSAGRETNP
ncbi:hypothetical protein BMS3Abin01_00733 [bacterium BMS3Abin01]|nr:hypothetical protein BMS3Abin01_00733 [bacterium BMS3Abin01]HDZ59589.1 hypothetical protein [Actinomycetota bacterium]